MDTPLSITKFWYNHKNFRGTEGSTQNQKKEASSNAFCRMSTEKVSNNTSCLDQQKERHRRNLKEKEAKKSGLELQWNWPTWKRIKCIKDSNNSGLLNQNSSSRGLILGPAKRSLIPALSNAKVAIMCCSFAPTNRTSCRQNAVSEKKVEKSCQRHRFSFLLWCKAINTS